MTMTTTKLAVALLAAASIGLPGCAGSGGTPPLSARDPEPCAPGSHLVCHEQNASRLSKHKLSSDRWCACETLPVVGPPNVLDR